MMSTILAVFWKEWKALQPLFWFIILYFIYGLFVTQFDQFMDEKIFWSDIILNGESFTVQSMLLALLGCLGLLTREKDDSTLTFLEGLPVKRGLVYCVKSLLAFILVSGFITLITIEVYCYEQISLESTDSPTPLKHIFTFWALNTFLVAFYVCVALLLSFLRLFSLLVIFLYIIFASFLFYYQFPGYSYFNPFKIMEPPREVEDAWVIPWARIIPCAVIGAISWGLGYLIFVTIPATSSQNQTARKVINWILGIILVIIFLFFAMGHIVADAQKRFLGQNDNQNTGRAIKTVQTERFQFVYRENIEERLQPLIDDADKLYKIAADLLEADESTALITVDMTQPLASHNAGQAFWNKIRMGFPKKQSLAESKAILGHEIVHVLIDRITQRRLSKQFQSARWFHEGLASYVEMHHYREAGGDRDYNRWLALASTWDEVKFTELVNNNQLSLKRDTNLVYPAGLEFIEAAVDEYGEAWLPKILRSIGREGAPKNLNGLELWSDACHAGGFDLDQIRSRFRDRLAKLEEENEAMCSRLPEVTEGNVTRDNGKIIITPDLPEGWRKKAPKKAKLICRIRPTDTSQPLQWRYAELNKDNKFVTSALSFRGTRIGFQVGWVHKNWCADAVFGEWVNTSIEK